MMKKWGLGLLAVLLSVSAWASPDWREGLYYPQGARVFYLGQSYEALQSHRAVKGANWNPEAAAALWRKTDESSHGAGDGQWREGRHYSVGEISRYRGHTYRCLQNHKAEKGAGWNPERAPSLWEKVSHNPGWHH
ncbi:carbohydrate-binding protein [Chitinibacter sp. GC72]|uniref:carbohydrate-binding protein n=1 Tax=Chitinibacter sp. GC72 TaxID=1526917 RepID=UPI0012F75587|nr:carbohydrate-binding protein [Chitinibacter sp. GC72]